MSERQGIWEIGQFSTDWPLSEHFGAEAYDAQVEAVAGPAGVDLVTRSREALARLRTEIGEGSFDLLDSYVTAAADAACAREEAVAAVCYGLGLGAGRLGAHGQLGAAVVGAPLASGLPAETAITAANDVLSTVSAAVASAS